MQTHEDIDDGEDIIISALLSMRLRPPESRLPSTRRFTPNTPGVLGVIRKPTRSPTRSPTLSRSPTPTPTSPPPPRQAGPSPKFQVSLFEGEHMFDLKRLADRFSSMCYRPGYGVMKQYIADKFDVTLATHPNSVFGMVGTQLGRKTAVAFARCTLYNQMPGVRARRIVFIDLVCAAKDAIKGAGAILMAEIERYARDTLGAHLLVLQSVMDPRTLSSYSSKGFVRGPGDRSAQNIAGARQSFEALRKLVSSGSRNKAAWARMTGVSPDFINAAFEHSAGPGEPVISPQFMNALKGEFYAIYNDIRLQGDTVVMSKWLQPASRSPGSPGRPNMRVRWQGTHGSYAFPLVDPVWAMYGRGPSNARLVRFA